MSFNPLSEVKYRYRLAIENLERAKKLLPLRDWVGVVASSQLAIENFAKAVIAIFEVPTWSHDPSNQLNDLINRLSNDITDNARKLANLAKEFAPEHGRSTYGEPTAGLLPSDIYMENHALNALEKAKEAEEIVKKIFNQLNIGF
ncbi:MAG: HEPN domain-containing protein [Candidatus Bathyarchaeia archaeon]